MASTISAGTTTTTALVYSADTSGVLQLQTNGTTTAVTIDTSQNVGVGVTPSAWGGTGVHALQIAGYGALAGSTGSVDLYNNTYYNGTNFIYSSSNPATRYSQNTAGGTHAWYYAASGTSGGTVSFGLAMSINNSGYLIMGNTTNGQAGQVQAGVTALTGASNGVIISTANASGAYPFYANALDLNQGLMGFGHTASTVGSITISSGTSVAYNTTSDRRLKTNIVDLTNSGTIIDSLKPRAFTWISDNSADVGFIADEFQQVLPKAVVGQPNAIDEEGKPVYQQIDASQPELIAYLVAEIQSLRARLKAANIA